ncbi:Gfo/Idh/MocA family oxidoreductase [Mycobacterium sp. 21AC1]|uniref:Gfo/Idh/MocA family protein n=1 Tax=[Mycobacterium] appelbergii TaxID=2939269 RepID=UPI0029395414|nr:Gfo/Idh/MocA family oxidoreductase [Mycobacterium sp. 21AC1]MDV3126150.1 Gfo/Idh/MocA family oxidoreductase [Mycobacterium sp. 21AC1]
MTTVRIAIVGTGMIAAVHLRSARNSGANVIGVLGSSPERSTAVASQWSVPNGYADLDALLVDRPDVVHICTPNNTHASYAEAVITAGIHVIIEKPVATTVDAAARLVDVAQSAGVIATVPYVYRYHPLVREIRARRIAGELGDIALVHGSYLQDWLLSPRASTWRVDPAAGGASRAFADIGTHWCDLTEFVSGETFTSVSASTTITYPERPAGSMVSFGGQSTGDLAPVHTEDIAVATFRTARGITANTVISQVSAGRKNRLWLEVDGTRKSAVFDQENPESIWLGTEHGTLKLHRGEADPAPDQARLNRTPPGHAQGWTDAFDAFVADTYATIDGARPDGLPTLADGMRSTRIVEAVLDSAASGQWSNV